MPRINANQLTHISIVPRVTRVIGNFNERDAGSKPRCKHVVLHYTEHRRVPTTCFGDTGYFVDRVRAIR